MFNFAEHTRWIVRWKAESCINSSGLDILCKLRTKREIFIVKTMEYPLENYCLQFLKCYYSKCLGTSHRILNDLYRSRLFRRMIWLLPHPLLPLLSVSLTGDTQEDCERETTLWAKYYDGKKAWFLHISFNTLWNSFLYILMFFSSASQL